MVMRRGVRRSTPYHLVGPWELLAGGSLAQPGGDHRLGCRRVPAPGPASPRRTEMRGSGGRWWYDPHLGRLEEKRGDQTLSRPCLVFLAREVLLRETPTYPHFGLVSSVALALVRSGGAVPFRLPRLHPGIRARFGPRARGPSARVATATNRGVCKLTHRVRLHWAG
jgi:hypothetical protein